MYSRTRKKRNKISYKKTIILTILISISCVVFCLLLSSILKKNHNKVNFEKEAMSFSERNSSPIFSIGKIVLYSSASANNNETNRNLWNLDIYQFTDIAIYLNNNSNNYLNSENTIKELYIDNISYSTTPERGFPSLYYKDIKNFGFNTITEENKIDKDLSFKIISFSDNLDTTIPSLYNTCQNPLTLSFVNNGIKKNAIIPNTGEQLKFDGSLLSKANISLNSIKTTISFNINITNNLDEKFINKISIPIQLEDENTSIYDGYIKKDLTNISNSNFLKLD